MHNIRHMGLFFTQENVAYARKKASNAPLQSAWAFLADHQPMEHVALVQWNGLKWVFQDDSTAAQAGIDLLQALDLAQYIANQKTALQALTELVVLAHGFELLRSHPVLSGGNAQVWAQDFYRQVMALNEQLNTSDDLHQVWLATLNIVAGIVAEDQALFDSGAERIRAIIDNDVHPSGYIERVVDKPNGFENFLYVVSAMVLACAAAETVNVDLWGHNKRGVSTTTMCLYPLYYFYYPEKWPWQDTLSVEEVQAIFTRHSGFLEIVNQHIGRPTHAIELIFKDIRPIYDPAGGGLTTLTHGVVSRRGLFG